MILSACSTPSSPTDTKLVGIPEHLMQEFCDWKGAGNTVKSLADGYVSNTLCGKKYEAQVREQREYVRKMKGEI